MSWDAIIERTRLLNAERDEVVESANAIRDRYHAFLSTVKQHFGYWGFLEFGADKFKFVPEKSSLDKGFLFAKSKEKFVVPTDYLLDPERWEDDFLAKVAQRIDRIREGSSEAFFNSLGTIETNEWSEHGVDMLTFRSADGSVEGRRRWQTNAWHYLDKATGEIYKNTNGTVMLIRNILDGTATPMQF